MHPHAHPDSWLDPALQLQPGQRVPTPAQEAEARRFATERIRAQMS